MLQGKSRTRNGASRELCAFLLTATVFSLAPFWAYGKGGLQLLGVIHNVRKGAGWGRLVIWMGRRRSSVLVSPRDSVRPIKRYPVLAFGGSLMLLALYVLFVKY